MGKEINLEHFFAKKKMKIRLCLNVQLLMHPLLYLALNLVRLSEKIVYSNHCEIGNPQIKLTVVHLIYGWESSLTIFKTC